MALGASRRSVLLLPLGRALRTTLFGMAPGVAGAILLSRGLTSILPEMGRSDPKAIAGAAVLLIVLTVAAAWCPARGASRVDPIRAIRAHSFPRDNQRRHSHRGVIACTVGTGPSNTACGMLLPSE
jgi:ABC-type antimicrobial peptide transport system permease subunit